MRRLFGLGILALLIAGCQGAPQAVDTGAQAIGKGVEGLGRAATERVVGRLLTDRSRTDLLREQRELREHMGKVEGAILQGRLLLSDRERRILQDAKDSLAAAGRQLEAPRIPLELGLRVQAELDKVREAFSVLRQRHNIPAYSGFVATR